MFFISREGEAGGYHVRSNNDFYVRIQEAGDRPVVVEVFAKWCGHCRSIVSDVDEIADRYASDAVVLLVDTDKFPVLSQKLSVRGYPTFIFFMNGNRVRRFTGPDVNRVESTIQELIEA